MAKRKHYKPKLYAKQHARAQRIGKESAARVAAAKADGKRHAQERALCCPPSEPGLRLAYRQGFIEGAQK